MLIQVLLSFLSAIFCFTIDSNLGLLSSIYGSLVSLVNRYLISRISKKQQNIDIGSATVGLRIMVYSVISRFILVAFLILIGLKLDASPFALLIGFALGQVGALVDIIGIKNGK